MKVKRSAAAAAAWWCPLLMTGLAPFFRDVNNKIKGLEKMVESLDALSGSVDEMKGGFKEILGRLGSPNLEEEGTDAPPKMLYTMKHRLVDPNSAISRYNRWHSSRGRQCKWYSQRSANKRSKS